MNPEIQEPHELIQQHPVEGTEPVEKGRVLVLEDDPVFMEVIRDFLVESGYKVVAVQNGKEGVTEVLAGDFALILCDMDMPTMPGDMFYRAVERLRPRLCERFLFMTGYRGDGKASKFIKEVNGYVLEKPFHLKDLAYAIVFTEVRRRFQSVFDIDSSGSFLSQTQPSAEPCVPETARLLRATAPATAKPIAKIDPRLEQSLAAVPERALESRPRSGSLLPAFVGVAFLVALLGGMGAWNLVIGTRVGALSAELSELSKEWPTVSAQLREESVRQSEREAVRVQSAQIAADRGRPRWTPALRGIAVAVEKVHIDKMFVLTAPEDSGGCEMRFYGSVSAQNPRLNADRFRISLEDQLKKSANNRAVETTFEQLDDEPATDDQQRATFVILAAVEAPHQASITSPEEL